MSVFLKKLPTLVAVIATLVLVVASFSPVFAQASGASNTGSSYTTVAGDTLQSVAQKAGAPVEQVFTDKQNQNLTLVAGQTVNAPTASTGTSSNQGSTSGSNTGSSNKASGSTSSGSNTGNTASGSNSSSASGNQTGSGSTSSQSSTSSSSNTANSSSSSNTANNTQSQVPVTGNTNAGLPVPPALGANQHYIVVFPGEYLSTYAVRYNTTIDKLLAMNPQIKNRSLLLDGQVIVVPDRGAASANNGQVPNTGSSTTNNSSSSTTNSSNTGNASSSNSTTNSSNTGNTNSSSTGSNATNSSNTGNANSSNTTNSSNAGSNASGTTSSTAQTYTTVKGDTLMSVAAKFNTTVAQLVKANPTLKLDAGQTVTFPAASTSGSNASNAGSTNSSNTTSSSNTTNSTNTGSTNSSNTTNNTNTGNASSSSSNTANNTQVPVTGNTLNFTGNSYYDAYFAQFKTLNSFQAFSAIMNPNGTFNACTISSFHNLFVKPSDVDGRSLYQVKRGESLEFIANMFGTTVTALRDMNCGMLSWDGVVYTGQWLFVPHGGGSTTSK